ncbi:phosphodiesterase [Anaerorhabdus sp.]|uniref:phosphodiesterase n=1 Tax=Anaerorhabdus sp. TaxID=1872524 RepID=UPI002B1FD231|nr:phosphodiesterase [Anaerorhabdus sp.]MEA4875522.1 phosphodiesterase [Anaerorhabdus sp.]
MKYLVVSDIHGSKPAAEKIVELMSNNQFDACLCLGDILYHGPRNPLPVGHEPKVVAELMNEKNKKIIAVRGNCDSEVDQMVLKFPIMSNENQLMLGNRRLFMTHGHLNMIDDLSFLNQGDLFLFGHTHIPMANYDNQLYLLNPGSMSLPKENYPRSYGVLDEEGFKVFSFDGDLIKEITF